MPDLSKGARRVSLSASNPSYRHIERDYLERTIATVRNHRDADNCWPQWANIFANEIERLWEENQKLNRSLVEHHNIRWLSEEAIKEGFGNPDGCQVCRRAHPNV